MINDKLIDKSFIKNLLTNYGTQICLTGLGFVWISLITYNAGIAILGYVSLLNAMGATFTNFVSFRTNESVISFYRQGITQHKYCLCSLALLGGIILDGAMACILFFLISLCTPAISTLFLKDISKINEIYIFSLFLVSNFLRGTSIGLLNAEEKFTIAYFIPVIENIGKICILLIFILINKNISLENIVTSMFISSSAVTSIVYFYPIKRIITLRSHLKTIKSSQIKSYFLFSFSTFISTTLKSGGQQLDILILGYLLPATSVGIFSLFKQFLGVLLQISAPFGGQLYPRIVQARSQKNHTAVTEAISLCSRKIILADLFAIPSLFIIFYIYCIFNNIYIDYYTIVCFYILALSYVLSQMQWWSRSFFLTYAPQYSIYLNLIPLIITTPIYFILGKNFQLLGICLSSLICSFVMLTTIIHCRKRILKLF